MQAALARQSVVADALRRVFVALGQVVVTIGEYRVGIGGEPATPSSVPGTTSSSAAPTRARTITNSHGDQYPSEAAGLVENLPPRVEPGAKQRTKGRANIGDKTVSISLGEDPHLSLIHI